MGTQDVRSLAQAQPPLGAGLTMPLLLIEGEEDQRDVVFPIAGTGAPSPPGRRAWVLPLKLAGYRTGSVLFR